MKLRNVVAALSAALIGMAAPGIAQAARTGGGGWHGGGGSHFSGGHAGGGHFDHDRGRGFRGGFGGFGLGLGVGLLAAPYVVDPYYPYGTPYYPPEYPPAYYGPYGAYDPGYQYSDPYAYGPSDPSDPRY